MFGFSMSWSFLNPMVYFTENHKQQCLGLPLNLIFHEIHPPAIGITRLVSIAAGQQMPAVSRDVLEASLGISPQKIRPGMKHVCHLG